MFLFMMEPNVPEVDAVTKASVPGYVVATGSNSVKVVPMSSVLFTLMKPLFPSMIPLTMDNPRPVPTPSFLVVKKGSKILSICD